MTARFGRILCFSTALVFYASDRFSKLLAMKLLHVGESVRVLPGIFHITLVLNTGAAFGLLKERAALFIVISAAAATYIIIYAWRHKGMIPLQAAALGLILGGALGNLVDRMSFGYVIDIFDFRVWPVFNIADSCISVGVALLAAQLIFRRRA